MLGPRFSTVAPKLELLPCPNTKGLCRVVFTLLCRLSCLANGAIATEIFSCTIRHFQESSNRKPYKNTLMNQPNAALRLADRFQSVSRFSR